MSSLINNKIGILGGTFDPVHYGHINMAKSAFVNCRLNKVLLMPSKNPPHKNIDNILPDKIRSDMIKLAVSQEEFLDFSDFELIRQGITYTSDTLEQLNSLYETLEFYYIVGSDSFAEMSDWHSPEVIFSNAVIAVYQRDTESKKLVMQKESEYKKKYNANIVMLPYELIRISSTKIRASIRNGEDISGLVPEKVRAYILTHNLYK